MFSTNAHPPHSRWYWTNLLRIRTWWFTLMAPVIVIVLFHLVGIPLAWIMWLYIPLAAITLLTSLRTQMACRYCATLLRVTRLAGEQEVCQKCGRPTDAALRS